ncbi:MAG: adenylyltransferase/cytidyltransferase family protein [Patescibacteria group bacterium]
MKRTHYNSQNATVMAFGTFDIIHPGHISYLQQAKRLGKKLVVVIARDKTVITLKGRKPIFNEQERLAIVGSLGCVDQAILGDKIHHCKIIDRVRPEIVCLGYDQDITNKKLSEQLERMHISVHAIVRARAFRGTRYKSSLIKKAFCAST